MAESQTKESVNGQIPKDSLNPKGFEQILHVILALLWKTPHHQDNFL